MKRVQGLRAYAVRRLLLLVPLVFLISVVVFLLVHMVPGGPVSNSIVQADLETIRSEELQLEATLTSQFEPVPPG